MRCYFVSRCTFPAETPKSTRADGRTDIRAFSDVNFLEKATENTLEIYQDIMWNVETSHGPVMDVFEVEGTREHRIVIGFKVGSSSIELIDIC